MARLSRIVALGELDPRAIQGTLPAGCGLCIVVQESAVLDDGTSVLLRNDRGLSVGGEKWADAAWTRAHISVGEVSGWVYNTVIPDEPLDPDDPDFMAEYWEWVAEELAARGIDETAAHVESVGIDVQLGPALLVRLGNEKGD